MQFDCCGVEDWRDWTNATLRTHFPDPDGHKVPKSCCSGLKDTETEALCQMEPEQEQFQERLKGCFKEFEESYRKNEKTIGIVTLIIISAMVKDKLNIKLF